MAQGDLGILAEAQRETVRALAELAGKLGSQTEQGDAGSARLQRGSLEQALESTARAVGDLGQTTAANTQALTGVARELGGLPGLIAGLAGVKGGGSVLGSVLKSGLGLVPLGLKIAGLFRGGEETPATPTAFSLPPSLAVEAANTDQLLAGFAQVVRGQEGGPRAVAQDRPVVVQPQVTVNVSAMDSRSFLDHSGEIAQAVREAMLHMHPVNDLISEL